MRGFSVPVLFSVMTALGCSSQQSDERVVDARPPDKALVNKSPPPDEPLPEKERPVIAPLPRGGTAEPATVRLVNPTKQTVHLDDAFGPLSFLGASSPDGALGLLSFDTTDNHCDCLCESACPDCGPPVPSVLDIAPGGSKELMWNGTLRRLKARSPGACDERFAPAGEQYVLAACTQLGELCAETKVQLPTADPIVLSFAPRADLSCPFEGELLLRSTRAATFVMDLGPIVAQRRSGCDVTSQVCVPPEGLAQAREAARARSCTHFVIPRGGEIEVETFLPLPDGLNGGETFSVFLTPLATKVTRARYTQ